MADGSASASASKWLLYKIGKTGVVTDIPYVPFRGALIRAVKKNNPKHRIAGENDVDIIVRHWMHADKTPVDVNGNFPEVQGDTELVARNYYIIELPPTEDEIEVGYANSSWHTRCEATEFTDEYTWVDDSTLFKPLPPDQRVSSYPVSSPPSFAPFSLLHKGVHDTHYAGVSVELHSEWAGWGGGDIAEEENDQLDDFLGELTKLRTSRKKVAEAYVSGALHLPLRRLCDAHGLAFGHEEQLRAQSNKSGGFVDIAIFGRHAWRGYNQPNYTCIVGIIEIKRTVAEYKWQQFVGELSAATAMSWYGEVAGIVWCPDGAYIALCSKRDMEFPMRIAVIKCDPTTVRDVLPKAMRVFMRLCAAIDANGHNNASSGPAVAAAPPTSGRSKAGSRADSHPPPPPPPPPPGKGRKRKREREREHKQRTAGGSGDAAPTMRLTEDALDVHTYGDGYTHLSERDLRDYIEGSKELHSAANTLGAYRVRAVEKWATGMTAGVF